MGVEREWRGSGEIPGAVMRRTEMEWDWSGTGVEVEWDWSGSGIESGWLGMDFHNQPAITEDIQN